MLFPADAPGVPMGFNMRLFDDLGIRRKVQGITLVICGAVLAVVIGSLFLFQVLSLKSSLQHDISTFASVIADNCVVPAAFGDEDFARDVLNSLEAKPTIIGATLVKHKTVEEKEDRPGPFDNEHETGEDWVLAGFGLSETLPGITRFPSPGTSKFDDDHLLLTEPVVLKGDRIGTLYLRADYRATFVDLLAFYSKVLCGVLLAAGLLGVVLSRQLSRTITVPILQLDQTARAIGEKKDYSVRAHIQKRSDELGRLASSFNEMLDRIQAQDAALSLSQRKMEALIHSIDGIVWERNPETMEFTFVSRQAETMLGYALQSWLEQPNFWAEKLHRDDAAKAQKAHRNLAAKGQPFTLEYRMVAADGRTVWIRESATVLIEQGKPVALRGILLDVTRQKLDAEELDKLNRQLVDTSRAAGMADVASGVLHNVGNVLNSVGVAATIVGKRLRDPRVGNLRRAAMMLRDKNGDLASFLTSDPKGKLVPQYIVSITDELAEEQNKLVEKMDLVAHKIDHIKEIVAMQQSYARVSGAYENLQAATLVEDALRINSAAFDRHGIGLIRDFAPDLPSVCADRHKVLQILINLLKNAKQAMEHLPKEQKKLVISIDHSSEGMIRISLKDNGVGIPAENLGCIFNFGFTTRKDGHGFGLHSGANAAKEMGGSLTGHSTGPGLGAEFVLQIPVARNHNTSNSGDIPTR
jgi:PAS domain S-box-containing protein